MDFEKSRIEFNKVQRKIAALNHAAALMFLDGETTAPPETAENRIVSLEVLNDELYNTKYGDKTVDLVCFLLENEDKLNEIEKRSLILMKRDMDKKRNVPKDEYIRYESLLTSAQDAWHKANEEHDLDILIPYLEKVFDHIREMAINYSPDMTPYEYCLDKFEPGVGIEVYDREFEVIKNEIVPLLQRISEKPPIDDRCLKGDFSKDNQEKLSLYIMELMGLDMGRVGLATAEHPFSTNMGSHFDERIVTKYSRRDFTFSLYTILYECGHILFEMGQDDAVGYTVIDGAGTMGFLESQTRFYENIIGRSRPFIKLIYPKLRELFRESVRDYTPDDLYRAVNRVTRGPIRIGSDEVTNNLHVLIRYEIEKALMDKSLAFADLTDAWAEKYKKYLDIDIDDPVKGVLQDIHWVDGAIGYFPTAVIGNIYSALMAEKMSKDLDISSCIGSGNISDINNWLREHVWKWAGLNDTDVVISKYLGITDVTSEPYVDYLTKKYTEIYNL